MTVFDKDGGKVQTITSEKCYCPDGLTVDQDDQIYVSCENSLFKFNTEGNPIKVVGQHGTQPGEFSDLCLIRAINDKVYVCDRGNHRVQILNTNLEYMNTFGCYGDGDGQFNRPTDIAQDRAGNLYVTGNHPPLLCFEMKFPLNLTCCCYQICMDEELRCYSDMCFPGESVSQIHFPSDIYSPVQISLANISISDIYISLFSHEKKVFIYCMGASNNIALILMVKSVNWISSAYFIIGINLECADPRICTVRATSS